MKKILLSLFSLLLIATAVSQPLLQKPVQLDPNVKTGQLKNGLTYYIQRNTTPPGRVELRLAVNAGSIPGRR
ncbi:MAG: hypothetical protein IPM52_10390 [Bacteroidetes bacterium]|nr:hypothetical protein [Bacteroidota bacterium]